MVSQIGSQLQVIISAISWFALNLCFVLSDGVTRHKILGSKVILGRKSQIMDWIRHKIMGPTIYSAQILWINQVCHIGGGHMSIHLESAYTRLLYIFRLLNPPTSEPSSYQSASMPGCSMPAKKRTSGGGGAGKAKAQKTLPGVPADSMKMAHMKKFEDWSSLCSDKQTTSYMLPIIPSEIWFLSINFSYCPDAPCLGIR